MEPANIGPYRLVRRLASGGMAVVYLCERRGVAGFQKTLVAKLIRPQHAQDPSFVRMLYDEARLCARLEHPNIVQVFDVGMEDGVAYLVMEYVNGPSLQALVQRAESYGEVHPGHIAFVCARICRALHYAHFLGRHHASGIVHRDVSLQNILVTVDGLPKLIDFGIAKARDRLEHTQTGVLKGKLAYMAPEVMLHGDMDSRADVFGMGVCLYRALTGRFPNRFEQADSAPPSQLVPGLGSGIDAIVLGALAMDPNRRTSNAEQLAEQLEAVCSHGRWATSQEEVAHWVQSLFPGGPTDWLSDQGVDQSSLHLLQSRPDHTVGGMRGGVGLGLGLLALAGVAALTVVVGAATYLIMQRPPTPLPTPPPVSVHLDQTALLLREGRVEEAAQELTRVVPRRLGTPAERERWETLSGTVNLRLRLDRARAAVRRGDAQQARAEALSALQLAPGNAEATRILEQTGGVPDALPTASAAPTPRPPRVVVAPEPPDASPPVQAPAPPPEPLPPVAPADLPILGWEAAREVEPAAERVPPADPTPAVAVAAAPRPLPPAPEPVAPAPTGTLDCAVGAALPRDKSVRNLDQMRVVVEAVAEQALQAGVEPTLVAEGLEALSAEVTSTYSPGHTTVLHPRAFVRYPLRRSRAGLVDGPRGRRASPRPRARDALTETAHARRPAPPGCASRPRGGGRRRRGGICERGPHLVRPRARSARAGGVVVGLRRARVLLRSRGEAHVRCSALQSDPRREPLRQAVGGARARVRACGRDHQGRVRDPRLHPPPGVQPADGAVSGADRRVQRRAASVVPLDPDHPARDVPRRGPGGVVRRGRAGLRNRHPRFGAAGLRGVRLERARRGARPRRRRAGASRCATTPATATWTRR